MLWLHYREGLGLIEVAQVLGLSLGTVKSRLHYGLATLRRRLDDHLRRLADDFECDVVRPRLAESDDHGAEVERFGVVGHVADDFVEAPAPVGDGPRFHVVEEPASAAFSVYAQPEPAMPLLPGGLDADRCPQPHPHAPVWRRIDVFRERAEIPALRVIGVSKLRALTASMCVFIRQLDRKALR